MLSYCHSLVTQFATIETAYRSFLNEAKKVRVSFERPGWRSHPKSGANSQPNEYPFESLGKGLSGAENRSREWKNSAQDRKTEISETEHADFVMHQTGLQYINVPH